MHKLHEPVVLTHYQGTTPTVNLINPNGVASTITPVTDGNAHSIAFRPDLVGEWTLDIDGDKKSIIVTELSEFERAIGVGAPIEPRTHYHGNALAGEASAYDVPATPLWVSNSQGVYTQVMFADATDRTYLFHFDSLRVPYAGWVTGVRIRLQVDLSSTNLTLFQFVFFHGDTISTMSVRGRTENIGKARLDTTFAWLQFEKPVYCQAGDYIGLRVQTSSGTVSALRLGVLHPGYKAQSLSATTSGDGLTVGGTNWESAGVVAGDTVYMTNKGTDDSPKRTVVSVSGTSMVVTPAYEASLTGCYVSVGRGAAINANDSGLLRINTNPSDTGDNEFFNPATNYPELASPDLMLTMTRPVVALAGDSVMGGSGETGGGVGTLHDHHTTVAYNTANDMAEWIRKYTGVPAVNASRGGSYIHLYVDKYEEDDPLWGYLSQQWASVAEYRPSVVIYSSIHNDCNDFGIYIPTDAQYLAALDLLRHHCLQIGAELVMTTGTPLDARDANSQTRGRNFRTITRHWCARNNVLLIDTERLFHVTQVDESTEDNWHQTSVTTVWGRPLYDYYSDTIHPNSSGSDGANAYKSMAKIIANGLKSPTISQLTALLWRIQSAAPDQMDQGGVGVLNSDATDAKTAAEATQTAVDNLNDFDPANDTVARVTLVDTTAVNTDMRGTDSAATASELDALVDNVNDIGTNVSGLQDVSTAQVQAAAEAAIDARLPSGSTEIAGAGATSTSLDDITAGTTQPRVNRKAGQAFRLRLSPRNDGTHKCTRPIKLQPGTVSDIAVSIDVSPVFDDLDVITVGTPVVSGGSITATALGPRDEIDGQRLAMIELAGTATASEARTITVPVTLETNESIPVVMDVEVFAE